MRVVLFPRPVTFFGFLALFLFCRESALALLQQTRTVISLNGVWDIADSVSPYSISTSFSHEVPVPGLAHSAQPTFPDVALFDSREHIANLVFRKELPDSAIVSNARVSHQARNYFWYRTRFDVSARREKAIIKIAKAQFGIAVWLNGREIGEHFPCFTAATFDLRPYIRWPGSNELVVRVGAHPGVLPPSVSCGTDSEKNRWSPGIYADVSVLLSDNPVIVTVQVASHLRPSEVVTQTKRHNSSTRPVQFVLRESVHACSLPSARLWSPESPNLYVLETTPTRFGLREFRFDPPTRRAFLNGKPYFLRGLNVKDVTISRRQVELLPVK